MIIYLPGMSMLIMATAMASAMVMTITTVMAMKVAITITTEITVGKDAAIAAIAADVGMLLVVVAVEKTVLMTVVVYHQEQAESRVTKIPVDNNISSYFSYIL